MPRAKSSAPQRLGESEQRAQQWNMAQQNQNQNQQGNDVILLDSESDDSDYVPPTEKKAKKATTAPVKPRKKKPSQTELVAAVTQGDHVLLEDLLDTAEYHVTVAPRRDVPENGWSGSLGELEIRLESTNPEDHDQGLNLDEPFWIYVSSIERRSFLYTHWFEARPGEDRRSFNERKKRAKNPNGFAIRRLQEASDENEASSSTSSPYKLRKDWLEAFAPSIGAKRRSVCLALKQWNEDANCLRLDLYVTEPSLLTLSHPSDVLASNVPISVKLLMEELFKLEPITHFEDKDEAVQVKHDIDELYEVVKRFHAKENGVGRASKVDPQHSSLLPQLRPYQKAAVKWMLEQEMVASQASEQGVHPLYKEVNTLEGDQLYYNQRGGFLVREKPRALSRVPGGILADEMGLGKTVEVLSTMLCHTRSNVPKPDRLEPIRLAGKFKEAAEKRRARRRRRRSPSPTEWTLSGASEVNEKVDDNEKKSDHVNIEDHASDEDVLDETPDVTTSEEEEAGEEDASDNSHVMQVDGNEDGESSSAAEEQEEEDEGAEPKRKGADRRVRFRSAVSFYDGDSDHDSDEDYVPRPSTSRAKKATTKGAKPKASTGQTARKKQGILKAPAKASKKAKVIDAEDNTTAFDPGSVLEGRKVTAKSPMADLILDAVIHLTAHGKAAKDGASSQAIKKYLADKFNKKTQQHVNAYKKTVVKLVELRKLVNTTHSHGASGSFKVNPKLNSFDSRGAYASKFDSLSRVQQTIEEVITQVCYDGKPYNKEAEQVEANKHKKEKKTSTYQHLKNIYDREMAEMSEAIELQENVRKMRRQWNGTYFDTKVEQQDYFECICGSELLAEYDDKYRVQCASCKLWQHADCVKYDIEDPYRGEYLCPHCWTQAEPVASGATLIVSPTSISYQWIEEIQKHIREQDLRVLFYEGTKAAGYIQPRSLAKYDIVVTTYTVLQSETNYVDLPHSNSAEGRRFRNPKRFMAIPAPLPCVQWWRICLDEAQMIECTTTKTAEMALRLAAVNRWCVTGTPIEKSLNDLQGLLLFLGVDPYSVGHWWRHCLYLPYGRGEKGPMEELLCRTLWRSAKKDVLHQINIPKQTIELHWLSFSPIEEHFYRGQHIDISRDAVARIRRMPDLSQRLSGMDRASLASLLNPLLRLRQSCCHPQAVRGQFLNVQKQSSTMTMEDLLKQMLRKATLECEDAHRQVIAALNGQAAIDIIEEHWPDAAEKYREVLRLVEEHKDRIKTDTLQRLHTVTNLAELLEAGHEGIPPTLRDDRLRAEAEDLKGKYLSKYVTATHEAKNAVTPFTDQVEALRSSFECTTDAWYVLAVNAVDTTSLEDAMMKLVRDEMAQFFDVVNDKEFRQIERKYSNSRMVLYKVAEKVQEFDSVRDRIINEMKILRESPPETFLNGAVECHLRMSAASSKQKEASCKLCEIHDDIELYEGLIFHFVKGEVKRLKGPTREGLTASETAELEEKGVFLHDEQRKGTWGDSEAERLLRALLKFSKNRPTSPKLEKFGNSIIEDGQTHLRMLESMKKEFRLIRILWRQLYDHVAGVDELNMSVMRLRLRFEDEPMVAESALKRKAKNDGSNLATRAKDKFETIYILEKHDLPQQKLRLGADKTIAADEFRKKHGQLMYLENLKKSDFAQNGGNNPEACPVCQNELGTKWSVLQCGHCYCVECMRVLMHDYSSVGINRSLRCPVCRSTTYHAEISYVETAVEETKSEDLEVERKVYEEVKGSLSTKMSAIVRTLIKIQSDEPEAKALVFSTWPDVLDILASALSENQIQYAALHTQGKFKRNLQKFKNREDVKVLLLPISSGSHGLNLIEASHVLLIEPILNPAQELQAVGRVHRIGQTKPTVVHKFLVKNTIEERMHRILSNFQCDESEQGSHSTEENLLTVKDLKHIFVDDEDEMGPSEGRELNL